MSDNQTLVGKEISGCEILNKVAEGGMGSVYKARHKALNRIVCVKILSPALANDKKAVELFLTEARAIAELDHPNIVNVYNVGKEKGYYFIVMSFIEGQTLSMMLKRNKVLQVGVVLDLFDGILKGLNVAHEKGIIHRDIKPSNILINQNSQPKIVDFGIAKKVDKEKGSTKTTELAGTAYFIAPEQALGKDIDTRADLYSIGASLYYVLTGQFPYNGKNTIDIIQKHINEPVPNPAKLRKDLPGWLALAIQKLMSKNPDDRFQTAKEAYEYFKKMRAEDQLRLKSGQTGLAIDLGTEGPLRIVKEEKLSTESLKRRRAEDVYREAVSNSSGPGKHTGPVQMPKLDLSALPDDAHPHPASRVKPPSDTVEEVRIAANKTPKRDVIKPAVKREPTALGTALKNFFIFWPLFIVFAAGVVYAFFSWGKLCSGHVSETAGFISNLIAPFTAAEYAHGQMALTAVCIIMLALIFMSSMIKAYSRSTASLLFLAATSYMTGLFTPHVPFLDLQGVSQFILSPEYALCYLGLATAWALSLCWSVDRTLMQSVLGGALIALCLVLVRTATNLSIAPDTELVWIKGVFFASIFFGLLAVYYLSAQNERSNVILPTVFLVLGMSCMWFYSVSGLALRLDRALNVLVEQIDKAPAGKESSSSSGALTELLGGDLMGAQRALVNLPDKNIDLGGMTPDEKFDFLNGKIDLYAKKYIPEVYRPLFVSMLASNFESGANKMKLKAWDYAMSYPIANFNYNAQTNSAYYFLLVMLFAFASLGCAGTILFREEL